MLFCFVSHIFDELGVFLSLFFFLFPLALVGLTPFIKTHTQKQTEKKYFIYFFLFFNFFTVLNYSSVTHSCPGSFSCVFSVSFSCVFHSVFSESAFFSQFTHLGYWSYNMIPFAHLTPHIAGPGVRMAQ